MVVVNTANYNLGLGEHVPIPVTMILAHLTTW